MSGSGKSRVGLLLLSALLVPPVFRIIRSTQIPGGQQLRVWTTAAPVIVHGL